MSQKKYKAFLSYSHADEAFGKWLHKQLERYKIPKKLYSDYPNLPKSLYPIFRDRYELNAGDDLGVPFGGSFIRGMRRIGKIRIG